MTLVINPVAGPGAGKSTLAATLFGLMKAAGERVEFVTEYAKELTYERDWLGLADQIAVTREQERRQRRLVGQVDYIITDSPLPVALAYAPPPFQGAWFNETIWKLFDTYQNFNVFIERQKAYQPYGRSQSEEEAQELDTKLRTLFCGRIDLVVRGNDAGPRHVYEALKRFHGSVAQR